MCNIIVITFALYVYVFGDFTLAHETSALQLFAGPLSYDVETLLQLNDVARKNKEVGYKIKATLNVEPLWSDADIELLLKFQLQSPTLFLRGKHVSADFLPYKSIWDEYSDTTFYAHWRKGIIESVYLDPQEPRDILNYKRALISLFQFQVVNGERNETDVSGSCEALYETVSAHTFRKIKRRCEWEGEESAGVWGVSVRRVARYELTGGSQQLRAVHADELLSWSAPPSAATAAAGLKVRSLHTLALRTASRAAGPLDSSSGSLEDALASLPPTLTVLHLPLDEPNDAPRDIHDDDDPSLEDALAVAAPALSMEPLEEGTSGPRAAADVLALVRALRTASEPALRALLDRTARLGHRHMRALSAALGAAGTAAAHAAARSALLPLAADDEPPHDLAQVVVNLQDYLSALAGAPRVPSSVILDVLRIAEEARQPELAESALLAATAAVSRDSRAALSVRDTALRQLSSCRVDTCRALRLLALGNLRRGDVSEAAARWAEHGPRPVAAAAVEALRSIPPGEFPSRALKALVRVALNESRPLDVRGAALDLALQRGMDLPEWVAGLAGRASRSRSPELRRLLWQRLDALMADASESQFNRLRAALALIRPSPYNWDAQAPAGTSSVLVRGTGWSAGGWSGELESVQMAASGVLRRGAVRLRARDARGELSDALAVEMWTSGMDALLGGGEGQDSAPAEQEDAAGGLSLAVGAAKLPPLMLFNGQAELLGHVWSGAGSTPTAVVRAARVTGGGGRAPLAAGASLVARAHAIALLALDAQIQVSLWSRTARALLQLRTPMAAQSAAVVHTAWSKLHASAAAHTAPALSISADADFYDAVTLCVRAHVADHEIGRNVTLQSAAAGEGLRVLRRRHGSEQRAGRTLSLGRQNDAACRSLADANSE